MTSPDTPRDDGETLTPGTATDRASMYLRQLLFSGRLSPGDRVDQNAIADELNISRQPVREAVLMAADDGLLVVRPRHGVFVAPYNQASIRDIYEVYGKLRGYAAARVARTADAATIRQLENLLKEIENSENHTALDPAQARFHDAISEATGNQRLQAVLHSLARSLPGTYADASPGAEAVLKLARTRTRRVFNAIKRGDADRAGREVERAYAAAGELAIAALEEVGVFTPTRGSR